MGLIISNHHVFVRGRGPFCGLDGEVVSAWVSFGIYLIFVSLSFSSSFLGEKRALGRGNREGEGRDAGVGI